MILVPNLLRRLSGNKLWMSAILCSALLFSACDSLKKASGTDKPNTETGDDLGEIQGGKVFNPKTGRYETPGGKDDNPSPVDTVKWTDTPVDEVPPITSDGQFPDGTTSKPGTDPGQTMESYDVAVCLPFLGNRFKEYEAKIDDKSMLAINFYSGVKMAFDDLSAKGVRLNVDVLDTEASDAKMQSLLNSSELFEAEMIVGPVKTSALKLAANFAKKNKKILISPLNPSDRITENNPQFIQTNPSLKSHCEAIVKHALDNNPAENIVLVVRDKNAEKSRLKYFQDALKTYKGSESVEPFKEFIVRDASSDFNEMDPMPYIKQGKTTVFIVPSWSNENFVYALMRKISLAKGPNKAVVYGMPQWKDYTRISYDYYERLNLHISSSNAIDVNNPQVKSFRQRYFDRFSMVPDDNAILGYDLMMYFGDQISKNGTGFYQKIDGSPVQMLHSEVDFQPSVPRNNIENLDAIAFYENKYVNILEFKDYFFQKAK